MSRLFKAIKLRPDVMPVFVITSLGSTLAFSAIIRTLMRSPEVTMDRKNNPYPWQNIKPTQQSKFIRAYDYSKLKDERPKFE